jgi:hypothetical protein
MEQFDERLLNTIVLPDQHSDEEVLSAIEVHLPQLSAEERSYIASNVISTERNFMSDIERIALLVNYKARAAGRTIPSMADIDAALNDVLPTAERARLEKPLSNKKRLPGASAGPLQSHCRARAMALHLYRFRTGRGAGRPSPYRPLWSRNIANSVDTFRAFPVKLGT